MFNLSLLAGKGEENGEGGRWDEWWKKGRRKEEGEERKREGKSVPLRFMIHNTHLPTLDYAMFFWEILFSECLHITKKKSLVNIRLSELFFSHDLLWDMV